jgi:Protein of unknown function DUF72
MMWRLLWRISSLPVCFACARNWVQFFGNCRRASFTIQSGWRRSFGCSHARRPPPLRLRANTIAVWMDAPGRKPTEFVGCGMPWRCGTFVHGRGVRRPAAKARHCTRCGRHRGKMAVHGGRHERLRLVYVRLHGDEDLYVSGYSDAALQGWGRKIRAWARGDTPSNARLMAPRPSRRESPPMSSSTLIMTQK